MGEEKKIIPTVGRVVYYKARGSADGVFPKVDRAAIITEVIDSEKDIVSLCVLSPKGMFFDETVERGQEGGQWDWMPFQKASASNSQSAEPRPETSTEVNSATDAPVDEEDGSDNASNDESEDDSEEEDSEDEE